MKHGNVFRNRHHHHNHVHETHLNIAVYSGTMLLVPQQNLHQ